MMQKFDIGMALVTYFGFLVALTMREAAGAFVSKALGDRSAETTHRATLNPIPHIDPFGTVLFPLLMLVSRIPLLLGWAKPFKPDIRYFKKPKRDANYVYLAGPSVNLLIAILAGTAMRLGGFGLVGILAGSEPGDLSQDPIPHFLLSIGTANIIICVFNLIPVPNTDGWKLLLANINYNSARKLESIAMPINLVFLLLLILGVLSPVFGLVLGIYRAVFF
jgi:Zn-dependent protease